MLPQDTRFSELQGWLSTLDPSWALDPGSLAPASSDASFRRYFRIQAADRTLIIMDAPPAHEDCRPFVQVAQMLRAGGLNVPHILAHDADRGFMLLTDLGARTYLQCLREGVSDAQCHDMYLDAITALIQMQRVAPAGLPAYDAASFADELSVFPEWYVSRHHGLTLDDDTRHHLKATFDMLSTASASGTRVLVHRDFHSPNLMACVNPRDGANPGIIDFQDAVAGPITYDLASLVMDARTTWDEAQQLDWAIRYWEGARAAGLPVDDDFAEFHRRYEWLSLQRNLRILGVFARLNHRDGKAAYLDHMQRVNAYVRQVACRYGAFGHLRKLLDKIDGRQTFAGLSV